MQKMQTDQVIHQMTPVEDWKCHAKAMSMYFVEPEELSTQPRYNTALSTHDRVAELAESLAAEVIVARYFGLPYSIDDSCFKRAADVGAGLEVRWTRYDSGQLIVYPHDRDDDIAILVTGRSGKGFVIAGWMPVKVARRSRYKHGTQESWWVPQDRLAPIEQLGSSAYANRIS